MVCRCFCRNSFFMNFKIEKKLFCLWNTERISSSPKHLKSFRINPNIFKYTEFGESKAHKVTLHLNKAPTSLLLYAITNEKTVKLMQIDRLLSVSN